MPARPLLGTEGRRASPSSPLGDSLSPPQFDGLPLEEEALEEGPLEKELAMDSIMAEKMEILAPVSSPSLDFNDNEDLPTELSDSSDTHDEGG